jgi:hypothetical protein
MVTVGSIWGETLRFVRANLVAIAVWGAIIFAMGLLSMLLMAPFYQAQLAAAEGGTPQVPNLGGFFLLLLLMLVGFVILWAAVFRAVLFPERKTFFYLRVGMDELRLFATVLVVFVGGYIVVLIGSVILGTVLALLGRLVGGVVGAGLATVLSMIVIFCATVWAAVRISPCGPLTIFRQKVVIGPAWRLTRGAFWRLLGAYLLLTVMLIAIYLVVFAVQFGLAGADISRPDAVLRSIQAMQGGAGMGRRVLNALLGGVVGAIALAFQAGMTAVATRQLLGLNDSNLGEVFA